MIKWVYAISAPIIGGLAFMTFSRPHETSGSDKPAAIRLDGTVEEFSGGELTLDVKEGFTTVPAYVGKVVTVNVSPDTRQTWTAFRSPRNGNPSRRITKGDHVVADVREDPGSERLKAVHLAFGLQPDEE